MGLKELLSGKGVTKRFMTQNGYEVVAVFDRKKKGKFANWATLRKSSIKHVNTFFDTYKRELYANDSIIPLTDEFKECRKVKASPMWNNDFRLTVNKDGSYHVCVNPSVPLDLSLDNEEDYTNGYKAANDLLNCYKTWYIRNYDADADAEFDVRFEDFKVEVFALVGDNEKLKKTRIQEDFQNYKKAEASARRNGDVFYAFSANYLMLKELLDHRRNYGEVYAIFPEDEKLLEQYDKNEYYVEAAALEKKACDAKLKRYLIFTTDLEALSETELKNAMKTVADLIYMSMNKISFSNVTAFMAEKERVLLETMGIRFEIAPGRGNTGNIGEVRFYDWDTEDGITFCSIKDHKVDKRLPSESPECWDLDGKRSFADDRIQKVIDAYKKRKLETGEVKEMKADPEPAKNVGRIIPKEETDRVEFGEPVIIDCMGEDSRKFDNDILLSSKENLEKLKEAYRKQDILLWRGNDNSGGGRDDR